jgi:hypothetical protein
MRIVSKFNDYYDTAMGMGIDPNLIYRRKTSTRDFASWPYDNRVRELLGISPTWRSFTPQLCVICFCGKYHSVWIDGNFELSEDTLAQNLTKPPLMSLDEVANHHSSVAAIRHQPRSTRNIQADIEAVQKLRREFDEKKSGSLSDEPFRDLSCPCFVVFAHPKWTWYSDTSVRVITNPRLATLGFQHVLDAFTAYQELSMFVGSQLAPGDGAPRTTGDDKTIARAKGFDDKSFRTQAPGQKKLNRQANKERKRPAAD